MNDHPTSREQTTLEQKRTVHLISSKVCSQCGSSYPADFEGAKCPIDHCLLAPVRQDPLLDTVVAGRYVIKECIGRGGWSKVYRAGQEALKRDVAIKVLRKHLIGDLEATRRFQREAEAAATLAHPSIVPVLDYGLLSDGSPYLVMELINGVTLDKVIEQQQLTAGEKLGLGLQMAEALKHAHEKGIVHRDVKPSNIMVASQRVRLLDFGIAKVLEQDRERTGTTLSSQTIGTADYMSPEQGAGRDIDSRSDIYSLGCVLFELFTGTKVFPGEGSLQAIHKHISEKPEPLHCRAAAPHTIPPLVNDIVLKCLQKDPSARYQSCDQLIEDLNRALTGDSALRQPAPATRLKVVLVLVPLLLVLIACFSGKLLNHDSKTNPPPTAAVSTLITDRDALEKHLVDSHAGWSAASQLSRQFAEIAAAIALRSKSDPSLAGKQEQELNRFRSMQHGELPAGNTKTPCVSVLTYHYIDDDTAPTIVKVEWTKTPMVLVLIAADGADWKVECAQGARVEKVIVVGPSQQVRGLAPSVPIINMPWSNNTPCHADADDYALLETKLRQDHHLSPSTFQSLWRYSSPLIVGPADTEWRAGYISGEMKGFYQETTSATTAQLKSVLSGLKVNVVLRDSSDTPHLYTATPLSVTAAPVSRWPPDAVTTDDQTGIQYVMSMGSFQQVVPGKEPRKIAIPDHLPVGQSTITFDSRRKHVICRGESALFTYTPAARTWAPLGQLATRPSGWDMDEGPITYCSTDDVLYALRSPEQPDFEITEISRVSPANGKESAPLKLSHPITLPNLSYCQLAAAGPYLYIFHPPATPRDQSAQRARTRVWVIDRKTGRIVFENILPVLPRLDW